MEKQKIIDWIEKAKIAMEENTKKEYPTCDINWNTLGADYGPKYVRVWVDGIKCKRKSVYCFIDYQGNILKASGWKAPAKGVRATIETKRPE